MVGLVTLFLGATAVLMELRDALNTIWKAPGPKQASLLKSLLYTVRDRFFSFALVLAVGFFLMVSLVVNAWIAAAGRYFGTMLPMPEWLLQVIYSTISVLVIAFLFAILYKVLPDVPLAWSDVGVGALVTSILFTVGKVLIGPVHRQEQLCRCVRRGGVIGDRIGLGLLLGAGVLLRSRIHLCVHEPLRIAVPGEAAGHSTAAGGPRRHCNT